MPARVSQRLLGFCPARVFLIWLRVLARYTLVAHPSPRQVTDVVVNFAPVVRRAVPIPTTLAIFVFVALSAFAQIAGGEARVTAVEHQAAGDRMRVIVRFDRPVRFVEGTAVDPYRIFLDVQGTRPGGALGKTVVGDPVLQSIRVAQYQPGITRVVLDVGQPASYSVSFLPDPPQLVVEISRTAGLAQTRIVAPPVPAKPEVGATRPASVPAPIVPPPAPPAAKVQAPTSPLAPADSKLASRFGAGANGDPGALLQAAQRGNPNAQFQMGDLYMTGHGVMRDPAAAAAWYRAAAQQGHPVAASNLGVLYAEGRGVQQSDAEAANWFRKAADAGDIGGENNLGSMYLAGRGVAPSDTLGAKWILAAAEHGAPEAQYALGTLYANGRGVARDDGQAVKWLKAAAAQGYAPAQVLMGKLYVAGASAPRDYAEAMRNFRSADTPEAWYQLGRLYQQGLGASASEADAAVWWLKAAERGLAEAQSALGRLYLTRDPVEAYSWFALAASSGDKEAVAAMNSLAPRLTAQQLVEAQQRALAIVKPGR